jgi:SPP1 family predicted phage head-tail adaptor
MRAGRLRHRVRLEQRVTERGAMGQEKPDSPWEAVANGVSVPAEVLGVSGGERVRGLTIEEGITSMVTIRYRSDVTADMRFVHDGRYLNINGPPVDREGRKRELVCMCQEKPS